jgi:protein phosphatase
MNEILVNVCGKTDDGCVREHNEDNILIHHFSINENHGDYVANNLRVSSEGLLMLVADGMGGANAGEVASGIAKETFKREFSSSKSSPSDPGTYLKNIILKVHKTIKDRSKKEAEYAGMGTTIIVGWLIENILHVVWVGDSRCYILRENQQEEFGPFTDDHSLVWNLVLAGEMSAEQARTDEQSNIILQSLGGEMDKPVPDYKSYQVTKGNRILFCSDGLNGMLSDQGIQQILLFERDTSAACDKMIQSAKNAGGKDNISVILMDVLSDTPPVNTQKGTVIRRKRRIGFWFYSFVLLAVILLSFILLDQGVLKLYKEEGTSEVEDTLQNSVTIKEKGNAPSKKISRKPLDNPSSDPEGDTVTIRELDSLRQTLSTDIRIKLGVLETQLNLGTIEQVDEHAYNKILMEIIGIKNQIIADTISYDEINNELNSNIKLKQDILVKIDSINSVMDKLNKLTKLKES